MLPMLIVSKHKKKAKAAQEKEEQEFHAQLQQQQGSASQYGFGSNHTSQGCPQGDYAPADMNWHAGPAKSNVTPQVAGTASETNQQGSSQSLAHQSQGESYGSAGQQSLAQTSEQGAEQRHGAEHHTHTQSHDHDRRERHRHDHGRENHHSRLANAAYSYGKNLLGEGQERK